MADQFESIIDRVEGKYHCIVIYFTTDSNGGSKKERKDLAKRRPWLLVPSCWAHQVSDLCCQSAHSELMSWQFQLILCDYFKVYEFAREIAKSATSLISWLNNHGKVRKMFNKAQAQSVLIALENLLFCPILLQTSLAG